MLSYSGYYSEKDFEIYTNQLKSDEHYKGIDFLLTGKWPKNFNKYQENPEFNVNSLKLSSLLAYHLKPRYHIVANEDKFYQRQPYSNYASVTHKPIHVTRLIGLASFPDMTSNSLNKKEKYLYAVKVEPLEYMSDESLLTTPADLTENPYLGLVDDKYKDQADEFLDCQEKANGVDNQERRFLSKRENVDNETKEEFDEMYLKKIENLTENTTLYVSGFDPKESKVGDIEEFLTRMGRVESFHLAYSDQKTQAGIRHKKFHMHMGYGFVKFKSIETTKKA